MKEEKAKKTKESLFFKICFTDENCQSKVKKENENENEKREKKTKKR